jgi:hypothetical protein
MAQRALELKNIGEKTIIKDGSRKNSVSLQAKIFTLKTISRK